MHGIYIFLFFSLANLRSTLQWSNKQICYKETLVQSSIDDSPITFLVKLPFSCSFIVDGLAFCCRCSHYMFRLTWPSSGV
jgi:hypothetical protein